MMVFFTKTDLDYNILFRWETVLSFGHEKRMIIDKSSRSTVSYEDSIFLCRQ